MSGFVFFSVAPFQSSYFQGILDQTKLQGQVSTFHNLPMPTLRGLKGVIRSVNWAAVVAEKCDERKLKGRNGGVLYRTALRLELLFVALRIKRLLDKVNPEGVAVWNGSHRYARLLMSLAEPGTKKFFFENGLLPSTTTLDPKGINYNNALPRTAEFFRGYKKSSAETRYVLAPRPSKRGQIAPIELPERFIFMPFQVDTDTQIRFFSPWLKDMREFFAVGEAVARATGMQVVFKEHPSSRHEYPDLHQRASGAVVFANGNATEELIRKSQFIITVNSTVGLESILLGKPLMTLGQACFNIEGLVRHAQSLDEVLDIAAQFPHWSLDPLVRDGFLDYLSEQYCIPGSWQKPDQAHFECVVRRLKNGLN